MSCCWGAMLRSLALLALLSLGLSGCDASKARRTAADLNYTVTTELEVNPSSSGVFVYGAQVRLAAGVSLRANCRCMPCCTTSAHCPCGATFDQGAIS